MKNNTLLPLSDVILFLNNPLNCNLLRKNKIKTKLKQKIVKFDFEKMFLPFEEVSLDVNPTLLIWTPIGQIRYGSFIQNNI